VSYARYLLMTFWPFDLAAFYPTPRAWPVTTVIVIAAVLLAISAWTFKNARRRPHLLIGWLWFVGILLPVIGIAQAGEQALADRFTYLPHIGLFIAVTWWTAETFVARPRLVVAASVAIAAF